MTSFNIIIIIVLIAFAALIFLVCWIDVHQGTYISIFVIFSFVYIATSTNLIVSRRALGSELAVIAPAFALSLLLFVYAFLLYIKYFNGCEKIKSFAKCVIRRFGKKVNDSETAGNGVVNGPPVPSPHGAKEDGDTGFERKRALADSVYYLGFTMTLVTLFGSITLFGIGQGMCPPKWYEKRFALYPNTERECWPSSEEPREDGAEPATASVDAEGVRPGTAAGEQEGTPTQADTAQGDPTNADDPESTGNEAGDRSDASDGMPPENRAVMLTLVTQNGAALLTTIVGIVARVFLIHFEKPEERDPFDPEMKEIRENLKSAAETVSTAFDANGDGNLSDSVQTLKGSLSELADRLNTAFEYPGMIDDAARRFDPQAELIRAMSRVGKDISIWANSVVKDLEQRVDELKTERENLAKAGPSKAKLNETIRVLQEVIKELSNLNSENSDDEGSGASHENKED